MNVLPRLALLGLALAAASGTVLSATEYAFGLQAQVQLPMGDLKGFTGNSTGFGAGAHMLVDLGGGHTVRPRLDFSSFPGRTGYFKMEQFAGGADYVYFTEGQANHGLYLIVGAGIANNNYETFQPAYARAYDNLYLALGAGYQLNRTFGLEVRFTSSRFTDQNGIATSVNATALAGTVRF